MSYIYLIELHKFIGKRMEEAEKTLNKFGNESNEKDFLNGRIQILSEFQDFLSNNYNDKLPRKIRKKFKKNEGVYIISEL